MKVQQYKLEKSELLCRRKRERGEGGRWRERERRLKYLRREGLGEWQSWGGELRPVK